MIDTEAIISTAKYSLPAEVCEREPNRVGHRAARFGTEILIDELRKRGFMKSDIIDGMKDAVSDAETEAPAQND